MAHEQSQVEGNKGFKFDRKGKNYERAIKKLNFALTFSALDPFAGRNGVRNGAIRHDRCKDKQWLKLTIPLTLYISSKILLNSFVRLIRSRLHDEQLIGKLSSFLKLIGDPYSSPPFPVLIVYLLLPLLAIWLGCNLPTYVDRIQPYDCAIARFIFEPEEEILKFDQDASAALKNICEAFKLLRWKLSHSLRFDRDFCGKPNVLHKSLARMQQQIVLMRKVGHQMQTIRPTAFAPDWHRHSYQLASALMTALLVINELTVILGINYFTWIGWSGRCCELKLLQPNEHGGGETGWPQCRLLDAFSAADLLMIVEINLMNIFIIAIPGTILVVFHIMQIHHQLRITKDIARRLREVLRELRTYNPPRSEDGDQEPLDEQLTHLLLVNIISLQLFERKSRKCTRMLEHGTRFAIFFSFLFTTTGFAAIRLQASLDRQIARGEVDEFVSATAAISLRGSQMVVYAAWVSVICQMNFIFFTCAMVPSRLSNIQRIIFSLVAQMVRLQQGSRSEVDLEQLEHHDQYFPTDDPITHLWRRLVLSDSFSTDQVAVSVCTAKLTYDRVLAIQFYFATVVSLLYSYIQ